MQLNIRRECLKMENTARHCPERSRWAASEEDFCIALAVSRIGQSFWTRSAGFLHPTWSNTFMSYSGPNQLEVNITQEYEKPQ